MKSKKGFTLVELLVTIVILGIITGISIPLIRNVQSTMTEKKYTTYYNGLKTSAKLYNDSYSEDLFGNSRIGVACIKYSDLEKRRLIKDINVDDMSCNRERTFVRVTKIDDKYTYAPFLACGKENTDEVSKVLPTNSEASLNAEFCKLDDDSLIIVKLGTDERGTEYDKKRRSATIQIASATGINNLSNGKQRAVDLQYKWIKEGEAEPAGWNDLTFKVASRKEQEKTIESGGLVTTTSEGTIITPQGKSGTYILKIRSNRLMDWNQNSWKNGDSNEKTFEKYPIDNEKPNIENLEAKPTNTKYNDGKVKITFKGSDTYTPKEKLKMCITTNGSECKPTEEYKSETTKTLTTVMDGKEYTIKVYLKDLAGNISSDSTTHRVAIKHTLKYNSDGGSACTNKSITHNVNDGTKWGDLCTPTKKGYKFDGWYDGNTKVTKDTKVTKNLNVKAKWTVNKYTVTFNANGGSVSPGSKQVTYDSTYGTLPTPTRTGYTFIGWFDTTKAKNANATYKDKPLYYYADIYSDLYKAFKYDENKLLDHYWNYGRGEKRTTTQYSSSKKVTITANQTLYAGWVPTQYTVTFNANGGSVSPGSKKVYYNRTYGTLPTPSRSGYIFIGWYTSGNFDSNYYSNTYSDIKNAFGTNYQKLVDHWIHNGIKEGRSGSANYIKANDTFKLTSNQTLYAGWVRYGANSSCGCASYASCSSCGCAQYISCKNSACGSSKSTSYIVSDTAYSCTGKHNGTITENKHCRMPGTGWGSNCCCKITKYTTNSCRVPACGCETYNSCSSCGCASYNSCYY